MRTTNKIFYFFLLNIIININSHATKCKCKGYKMECNTCKNFIESKIKEYEKDYLKKNNYKSDLERHQKYELWKKVAYSINRSGTNNLFDFNMLNKK